MTKLISFKTEKQGADQRPQVAGDSPKSPLAK